MPFCMAILVWPFQKDRCLNQISQHITTALKEHLDEDIESQKLLLKSFSGNLLVVVLEL